MPGLELHAGDMLFFLRIAQYEAKEVSVLNQPAGLRGIGIGEIEMKDFFSFNTPTSALSMQRGIECQATNTLSLQRRPSAAFLLSMQG